MIQYLTNQQINKDKWDACLQAAENKLIYANSWYLDIVSQNKWDALVLGDYQAIMPLVWNQKLFGIKQIYQPIISQQHGVFGNNLNQSLLEQFLLAIPNHFRKIHLQLNYENYSLASEQPNTQSTQNLVLDLLYPYEEIWQAYSKSLKKRLRQSREHLHLVKEGEVQDLITYYQKQLSAKVNFSPSQVRLINQLFRECLKRGCAELYQVKDQSEQCRAYGIFLFDKKRVYHVFSASDTSSSSFYPMHYLVDQVIQLNVEKREIFDFEGSEIPGVAQFFKSFGAEKQPYLRYQVDRLPWWLKGLLSLRS